MRWPRRLDVFGETWRVEVVASEDLQEDPDEEIEGEVIISEKVIRISEDLPRSARYRVLLHEILHVCWDEAGFNKAAREEDLISRIDTLLYRILNKNFGFGK